MKVSKITPEFNIVPACTLIILFSIGCYSSSIITSK